MPVKNIIIRLNPSQIQTGLEQVNHALDSIDRKANQLGVSMSNALSKMNLGLNTYQQQLARVFKEQLNPQMMVGRQLDMAYRLKQAGLLTPQDFTAYKSMVRKAIEEQRNIVSTSGSLPSAIPSVIPTPSVLKIQQTISPSILNNIANFGRQASTALNQVAISTNHVTSAFFNFRNALIGLGTGLLVREMQEVVLVLQRMQNSFIAATGSMESAGREMEYVVKVSKELGLDLRTASQQLAQMEVAARGTSLEGRQIQQVFEALSKASISMGLSTDQTAGAMYALQQMISKGRVATEELRRQLGERLPGAFQDAAKAMGMTTMELDKALEKGEIYAEVLLPRLAKVWEEKFANTLPAALESLQLQLNRASTSMFQFGIAVAEGGFKQSYIDLIKSFTQALNEMSDLGLASRIGEVLGGFIDYGTGILRVWVGIPDLLNENTQRFAAMAKSVEGLGAALVSLAAIGGAARTLSGLFSLLGSGGGIAAIGGASVVGLYAAFHKEIDNSILPWGKLNKEIERHQVLLSNLKEHSNSLISVISEYGKHVYHTAEDQNRFYEATGNLVKLGPSFRSILDQLTAGTISYADAVKELNRANAVGQMQETQRIAYDKMKKQEMIVDDLRKQASISYGASFIGPNGGVVYGNANVPSNNEIDQAQSLLNRLQSAWKKTVDELNQTIETGLLPDEILKKKMDEQTKFLTDYLKKTGDLFGAQMMGEFYGINISELIPNVFKIPEGEIDDSASASALKKFQDLLDKIKDATKKSVDERVQIGVDGELLAALQVQQSADNQIQDMERAISAYKEGTNERKSLDEALSIFRVSLAETTEAKIQDITNASLRKQQEAYRQYRDQLESQYNPEFDYEEKMSKFLEMKQAGYTLSAEAEKRYLDAIKEQRDESIAQLTGQLTGKQLDRLMKQYRERYDPAESFRIQMDELEKVKSGISPDTYEYVKRQLEDQAYNMHLDIIMKIGDAWTGAQVAMAEYSKNSMDYAKNTYQIWSDTIGGMEDLLTNMLSAQKVDFLSFFQQVSSEIIRLGIIRPLLGSLFALGSPGTSTANAAASSPAFGVGSFTGISGAGARTISPMSVNVYVSGDINNEKTKRSARQVGYDIMQVTQNAKRDM